MQSTQSKFSTRSGDGALKRRQIAEHLRDQIVRGELAPGEQLPTRVELEQRFGVSTVTVQGALDFLVGHNWVRVHGRRGTFVSETLPHLSRYALVMRNHPLRDGAEWGRFPAALCDEAARLKREDDVQISTAIGARAHTDTPAFQDVVREVEEHRLAGLIFLNPTYYLETPLMCEPGVARVGVGVNMSRIGDARAISLDINSFHKRALEFFAQRGCKRLAVLATSEWNEERFIHQARERGMDVRPQWVQYVHPSVPLSARRATHLLWSSGQTPDALLVSDDNLLEGATQGVLDAGISGIEIVAHCNFPFPTPARLPVTRLGFDTRAVFQACLGNIDAQRRGEPVPDVSRIGACFENELPVS